MMLTEFLLARIAEAEAEAERAGSHNGGPVFARDNYGCLLIQPAHVLAECKAKRRIVEDEHYDGRSGDYIAPWCSTCSDDENLVDLPCPTLRLLALPYADHEDYLPEWKP